MASPHLNPRRSSSKTRATITIANMKSWYSSIIIASFIFLLIITIFSHSSPTHLMIISSSSPYGDGDHHHSLYTPPCDEIYVVGEGETLHTISDKCGDPFIVERNPHIHDPDDVFPGLVIRIMPL